MPDFSCSDCGNSWHGESDRCPDCHANSQLPPAEQVPGLLRRAARIINGPRRQSYGPAEKSFEAIAAIWTQVLKTPVSSSQVALCMIGLKLLREANKGDLDNRLDLVGYVALLDLIENKRG